MSVRACSYGEDQGARFLLGHFQGSIIHAWLQCWGTSQRVWDRLDFSTSARPGKKKQGNLMLRFLDY